MRFFQEYFFLILFRSILQTIRFSEAALDLCSQLNFCIKGTITAADNLFDDQSKSLLPLTTGKGDRFASILQLMAFERLTSLALARGVANGAITTAAVEEFQKARMSKMAAIGSLEGSEEGGVASVLEPGVMIDEVHRVRGGALFELGFIAPGLVDSSVDHAVLARAQSAISRLGTAFQIVDDLTDFEVDLERGTHNILVAQITHAGTADERARLAELRKTPRLHRRRRGRGLCRVGPAGGRDRRARSARVAGRAAEDRLSGSRRRSAIPSSRPSSVSRGSSE